MSNTCPRCGAIVGFNPKTGRLYAHTKIVPVPRLSPSREVKSWAPNVPVSVAEICE